LTILKVDYNQATPILLLLTIDALILLTSQFYTNVILGIEKLDQEATIPLRKLAKSKIFKIFTLPYVQAAISIPTSLYFLSRFANGEPVLAAVYITTINLATHIVALVIQYMLINTPLPIKIPWKNIGKYVLAAIPTAITLHMLPDVTTLTLTVAEVAAGATIYLAILLTIDSEARKLVKAIWKELKTITKRST
jgi:hypothetical protein